jgi:hypothetical protein
LIGAGVRGIIILTTGDACAMDGYRKHGFAHISSAVNPALVASWRRPILDLASRLPNMAGGRETIAVFRPDCVGPAMAEILFSAALGGLAAQVLGVRNVRLLAGTAYIKPPGAPGSFWHQDLWFFPIADAPIVTIWLPLAPVEDDRAPLIYARGSQKKGFVDWRSEAAPDNWPLHRVSPMSVGDVTMHDGWTLHGSEGNARQETREALGLTYVRDGAYFATRAELQQEPARWERLSRYLDNPAYCEGARIQGPRCPLVPSD